VTQLSLQLDLQENISTLDVLLMVNGKLDVLGRKHTNVAQMSGSDFQVPTNRRRLNGPGVYIISCQDRCWYVGKSQSSMSARVHEHMKRKVRISTLPKPEVMITGVFSEEPSVDELFYIWALRPILNRETKGLYT